MPDPHATPERDGVGSASGFTQYDCPENVHKVSVTPAESAAREYLAQYEHAPGFEKAVADVARWTEKMMRLAERRRAIPSYTAKTYHGRPVGADGHVVECIHGHPTRTNLVVTPSGQRYCRSCQRNRRMLDRNIRATRRVFERARDRWGVGRDIDWSRLRAEYYEDYMRTPDRLGRSEDTA